MGLARRKDLVQTRIQALGLHFRLSTCMPRPLMARTTIDPHHHIIFNWITPALEEVEEQVSRLNINISCVRTGNAEMRPRISKDGDKRAPTLLHRRKNETF